MNDVRDLTHSKCLGGAGAGRGVTFSQICVLHYNVVTHIGLFSRVVF